MDVKTTFLNGDLEEEIYIVQLKGCDVNVFFSQLYYMRCLELR